MRHALSSSNFYLFFLLDSENESIEPVVKQKKMQCNYCLEIFNNKSITKHEANCQYYQELIEDDNKCGVCKKKFGTMQGLNMHIGHHHKEALLVLQKKKI